MSCTLGLWIGESFAEIRGFSTTSTSSPSLQSRWLLARRGLTDGLRDILSTLGPDASAKGSLNIATSRAEQILERKQGQTPALLLTSGFETWLQSQQAPRTPTFSLSPERAPFLTTEDRIFGITERTSAEGVITTPVREEELEFLSAKFELLKIRSIAIGFLHSTLNPESEKTVERYFREKGFNVTTSHQFSALDEISRWQAALECAYAESALVEEREQIAAALDQALGEKRASWSVSVWGARGLTPFSGFCAANARGGEQRSLLRRAAHSGARFTLFFGIESFHLLVHEPDGDREVLLPIQPTRQIGLGVWPVPAFGTEDRGYEPGPMIFGRSHFLTTLDLLFVRDRLGNVESLAPFINEKSRSRIMEVLFTLGKTIPNDTQSPIDAREVAEDLETACLDRISGSLSIEGVQGKVRLAGPLASAFEAILRGRRPDLIFEMDEKAEWYQADAALMSDEPSAGGGKKR